MNSSQPLIALVTSLDWQLGKGGFGTVYAGVYQVYNGSDSGNSTYSNNSKEDKDALQDPLKLKVAIKLER